MEHMPLYVMNCEGCSCVKCATTGHGSLVYKKNDDDFYHFITLSPQSKYLRPYEVTDEMIDDITYALEHNQCHVGSLSLNIHCGKQAGNRTCPRFFKFDYNEATRDHINIHYIIYHN